MSTKAPPKKPGVSIDRDTLAHWTKPGGEGFLNWLEDVQPMIPGHGKGAPFIPYSIPSDAVREEILRGLAGGVSTWCISMPRRWGKSTLSACVIAWRFTTSGAQTIAVVGNSERQGGDTVYRLVRTIFERTPLLRAAVEKGSITITDTKIEYAAVGSKIEVFPANAATLHGKKLTMAAISELHAARNAEVFETLQAATMDTAGSLVLVDSTVGPRTSPLFALYQLAQAGMDPTLCFTHISFPDIEAAIAGGPPWIPAERLRSRQKQLLPATFGVEHLNLWTSADQAAFDNATIDLCRDDYPLDGAALAEGRATAVGMGLDRALIFSTNGDATVLAVVAKVLGEQDDAPHYYVLECHKFSFSTESAIKRKIEAFRKQHGVSNFVVERYEGQDISVWAQSTGLDTTIAHATQKQQAVAFLTMVTAAREGRLHVHPKFEAVFREMGSFSYELKATGTGEGLIASFGHIRGAHDDHIYAICWAMHSLREVELAPYSIAGIACDAPPVVARMCILNGGDFVPLCSSECRSFNQIQALHRQYRGRVDEPLGIEAFFQTKVVNEGSHSLRR
ncbi:MAG: terminase large subunit [Alsobacter sp.]